MVECGNSMYKILFCRFNKDPIVKDNRCYIPSNPGICLSLGFQRQDQVF